MLDAGLVAKLFAVFRDFPRKCDGAMLAAGAAHCDGELAFAFLDVERKEHIPETIHSASKAPAPPGGS